MPTSTAPARSERESKPPDRRAPPEHACFKASRSAQRARRSVDSGHEGGVERSQLAELLRMAASWNGRAPGVGRGRLASAGCSDRERFQRLRIPQRRGLPRQRHRQHLASVRARIRARRASSRRQTGTDRRFSRTLLGREQLQTAQREATDSHLRRLGSHPRCRRPRRQCWAPRARYPRRTPDRSQLR